MIKCESFPREIMNRYGKIPGNSSANPSSCLETEMDVRGIVPHWSISVEPPGDFPRKFDQLF